MEAIIMGDQKRRNLRFIILIVITTTIFLPISFVSDRNDFGSQYCTIFSISVGDKVLFGNNEDYRLDPESSFISFIPPQEIANFRNLPGLNDTLNIYGMVVVGSIITQNGQEIFSPQGGMNDQGLCYDANSIPDEILDYEVKDWSPSSSHWDILWHCQTVDDVIDWYENHHITYSPWNGQWNYVDASGNAVVVTATNGEITYIHRENESYLVSTNFNRADPSSHYFDYPCWRYDTAVEVLEEIQNEDELTVEACRDILDSTHFEKNLFNDIQTLYSNIYDPVQLDVYLYYNHEFQNPVKFNLVEENSDVDESNCNRSLYPQIFDRTYIMTDLFNETLSDSLGATYLILGLGIGIPAIGLVAIVVYRKWK